MPLGWTRHIQGAILEEDGFYLDMVRQTRRPSSRLLSSCPTIAEASAPLPFQNPSFREA